MGGMAPLRPPLPDLGERYPPPCPPPSRGEGEKRNVLRDLDIAEALLAFVGYAGPIAARADDLPHVDRRLVEIARALATRPRVLLLDEPAAGLMRGDKDALGLLLRRIAQAGIAVILVEHDMAMVMGVSDHVVVLDAGRPIAAGAPGVVREDPNVIAAYLGGTKSRARGRAAPWSGPQDAVLSVVNLSAGYGAAPVLENVNIDVRPGELVALLGANGAGKSTIMKAVSGLLRPVSGDIVLRDARISALPAHRIAPPGPRFGAGGPAGLPRTVGARQHPAWRLRPHRCAGRSDAGSRA